jgi:hypothetical protein
VGLVRGLPKLRSSVGREGLGEGHKQNPSPKKPKDLLRKSRFLYPLPQGEKDIFFNARAADRWPESCRQEFYRSDFG